MPLLSKLKAVLGIGANRPDTGGTAVQVQPEVDADSERAVKEPAEELDDASSADTDVAAETSDDPVDSLSGIGPAYSERLGEAGIETVDDLASAEASTLAETTGIGEGRLETWIELAGDR